MFTVRGAQPGIDALPMINAALTSARLAGGGVVILPHIGGYTISDTVTVDFSNCTVVLMDDVTLTKATKASAFVFTGLFGTPISNSGLITDGPRRSVNGNGLAMAPSYGAYNTSDTFYSAVLIRWCNDWFCRNIIGTNGLVNSLRAVQCGRGEFENCVGSYAFFDNGISIDFTRTGVTWSDTDPETWSNGIIRNCVAFGNESLGYTFYAATGAKAIDCISFANGNDDSSKPHNGGGASSELDATNPGRDHRNEHLRCKLFLNCNYGLHVSCIGVVANDCEVSGTIKPVNRANPLGLFGTNIAILGEGTLRTENFSGKNSGGRHIMMLGVSGTWPSLDFDGILDGSVEEGIYGRGIRRLTISRRSRLLNIGTATPSFAVLLNNTGAGYAPTGESYAELNGSIEECGSIAIESDTITTVRIPDLRLLNVRKSLAGAGSAVRLRNANNVDVLAVRNDDANTKVTNILEIQSTVNNATVGIVSGDSTGAKVLNVATNRTYSQSTENGYDVYIRDEKAAGSAGGAAIGSYSRTVRNFGIVLENRGWFFTNNGTGAFTLSPGTYYVRAHAYGYKIDEFKLMLYSVTASTDLADGSAEYSPSTGTVVCRSTIDRVITLMATTQLRFEQLCQTANATDGLGRAATGFGTRPFEARITKIA